MRVRRRNVEIRRHLGIGLAQRRFRLRGCAGRRIEGRFEQVVGGSGPVSVSVSEASVPASRRVLVRVPEVFKGGRLDFI